jgi:hypothetical protein
MSNPSFKKEKMRKSNLLLIAFASILGACATNSGVVPLGPDTYLISHQGSGFWVMPTSLRNEALAEANQYCTNNKKMFKVVRTEMLPQIPFGQSGGPRFPVAEIHFMCLDTNDPELTRPKMQRDPDIIIENRIKKNVTIEHN